MTKNSLKHVDTWVFDLDNTLYPPSARIFDEISERMVCWVMDRLAMDRATADDLRATYWKEHGTTLAGLMTHHQIDPWDFLNDVHAVNTSNLAPAPDLAKAIQALPGRKIVYTNGDAPYAGRILKARGLENIFDAVYGVEHANWRPKPEAAAFETVFALDQLTPNTAAMFEDELRNLKVPSRLGMGTILVTPVNQPADFVDHHTSDLTQFLERFVAGDLNQAPTELTSPS